MILQAACDRRHGNYGERINYYDLYMPTRLVQFGQMDWEMLKKTYSTPVPKRGIE